MYLTYRAFQEATVSDMTESDYARAAAVADAVIDNWTLGRIGRAYEAGEELPDAAVVLYCAIVESVPAVLEGSKVGKGGLVSSFSNGVDSFSFDTSSTAEQRLRTQLGWMLDLLPVEWMSGVASYEGGWHDSCHR